MAIRGEDIAGRYGGDEFCMMFPHASAAQTAICLERIREKVAQLRFMTGDADFSITVTFGVADFVEAHLDEDMLIDAADQALYVAKTTGRNRIEVVQST